MQAVSLVSKHRHSIKQFAAVRMVVQRGSRGPTSTDRQVGGDTAQVVMLLTVEVEEGLKLALLHLGFNVKHHIHVRFRCDLGCPAHRHHLLIVFNHARVNQNIVHRCAVNSM